MYVSTLILEYLCYDDACHLRKYSLNLCRQDLTPTTKILSHLLMAVDKMHMAGHVDSWYKNTCDPHLFTDLNQVSLSRVCLCTHLELQWKFQ